MKRFWEEFKYLNYDMPKTAKYILWILGGLFLANALKTVAFNPAILLIIVVLLMSVVLHEVAHGYVAYLFGDDTAKNQGRLTLNPIKHLDLAGTLFPLFLILTGSRFIIGWAKPVPISFERLRKKKNGVFFVSIAGVTVNFILAFIGANIIKFFPDKVYANQYIYTVVSYLIRINLVLAIFNLIPIPPLDGSRIIWSLGSRGVKDFMESMENYGLIIILVLVFTGSLWGIILPIFNFFINLLNMYIKL
jgi:Zn-dependent protease